MAEYDFRLLCTACIILLFIKNVLTQISTTLSPLEAWKQPFVEESEWKGYYMYGGMHVSCELNVHSVQLDKYGIVLATFEDSDSQFDMQGMSEDGKMIIFRMSTAHTLSDRIPMDSEFQLSGGLLKNKRTSFWTYYGNISVVIPGEDKFGGFVMNAGATPYVNADGDSGDSKKVALTVGISLGAAVLGVVLMVGIAVWAVKSGYLRHVPSSYKNFRDDAAFSNTDNTVHI